MTAELSLRSCVSHFSLSWPRLFRCESTWVVLNSVFIPGVLALNSALSDTLRLRCRILGFLNAIRLHFIEGALARRTA